VYLNGLDHFVLRELKPGLYLRYVDDSDSGVSRYVPAFPS
jgi:hypothetical protein